MIGLLKRSVHIIFHNEYVLVAIMMISSVIDIYVHAKCWYEIQKINKRL